MKNDIKALAMELQSLAQAGLFYNQKDIYDIERFGRIREIASLLLSAETGIPSDDIKAVFCCESGYQTPKVDVRAVVFSENKLLLVQEKSGLWALPGGWAEPGLTPSENVLKELYEEAGIRGRAEAVIAIHDRNKRNRPVLLHSIYKIFIRCTALEGEFAPNSETIAAGYFGADELPPLCPDKNTPEQIEMCFRAAATDLKTVFD